METPLFILNSKFDSWQLGNEIKPVSPDDYTFYGNLFDLTIETSMANTKVSHSPVVDSC